VAQNRKNPQYYEPEVQYFYTPKPPAFRLHFALLPAFFHPWNERIQIECTNIARHHETIELLLAV